MLKNILRTIVMGWIAKKFLGRGGRNDRTDRMDRNVGTDRDARTDRTGY